METTNIILILISLMMPILVMGLGVLSFIIKTRDSGHETKLNNKKSVKESPDSFHNIRFPSTEIAV